MSVGKLAKVVGSHKLKTNFNPKTTLSKKQVDEFLDVKIGMLERIFKGKEEISFDDYIQFRNFTIEHLWHYEFHQFDIDSQDHMSDHDVAQSLFVYYIPFQKINNYLLHLDKFVDNKTKACDFNEYCAFQYFLR